MTAATAPKHPAKYSEPIIESIERLVRAEQRRLDRPVRVLDPFAGVGRIHRLARPELIETVGVEIEPEWAACHEATICDDSLTWMADLAANDEPVAVLSHSGEVSWVAPDPDLPERFDVIATSPCYGNRLADSHDARDGSVRRSYTHDLGRPLTSGSSGAMPWGPRYWSFHADAYRAMLGALRPGGLLLLNVSDFVRSGELVPAVAWHRGALWGAGFVEQAGERPRLISTQRLRFGENGDARAAAEVILRARRPA